MRLNFKNRIAFHYMIATALIMAGAFCTIYFLVQETVLRNLDEDLSYEARKHMKEVKINKDSIYFRNKDEWEEREHREVQVNPVFIQLTNKQGQLMGKSPNLKGDFLVFRASDFEDHFNTQISNRSIRQVQVPIKQKGEIQAYILAAISSEAAFSILLKLKNVLFISYLVILIGLYFISRFLAGRSIKPVQEVTNTITRIRKHNLQERVELPQNQDEIYELSTGFNALLDRIEAAMERERQFTSDASHELRTPLASLRGTLEVLIRKPRNQEQYEEKIKFSLKEIDKMTNSLEQLLLLARLDSKMPVKESDLVSLPTLIDESLTRAKPSIIEKDLQVDFRFAENTKLRVPYYYTKLMIDNIISNAVKYSKQGGDLHIKVEEIDHQLICSIQDEGKGIKEEDLKHIYERFFRSEPLSHKQISGNGLGLSIVKKCAEAIEAEVQIESTLGKGTVLKIKFKQILRNI